MNLSNVLSLIQVAQIGSKALGNLFDGIGDAIGAAKSGNSTGTDFASLLAQKTGGVSLDGRNRALSDPEAAFGMMSQINKNDVSFKAQFAELHDMSQRVEQLEASAASLSNIDTTTSAADITQQMQGFVGAYNAWVERFGQTVQGSGVLQNVQAAEVSLYELEQSVANPFIGAMDGLKGLPDIGLRIDPQTHRASLDENRLNSVLSANKTGVVNAVDQFSAHFAKAADLLNSPDNFLPKQLDNRSRAIDFLAHNIANLRTEFGTGNAAKPEGDIARALDAYKRMMAA